jgi:thiol-disulfide isomerase/thioredoxin
MKRPVPRKAAPPNRNALYISVGIIVVGLVVAWALASRVPKAASDAPIQADLKLGEVAPKFSVSTTHGPFDLANAGGKPTLVEVFATWCPHCQRETAVLNQIYDTYKDKLNVVAVSGSPFGNDGSTPESQLDVVNFQQKFSVKYPVAYDGDLDVAKKYLQGGFPTIVMIGRDGKIVNIRDGEVPIADLKGDVEKALRS